MRNRSIPRTPQRPPCNNELAVTGQWQAEAVWQSLLHYESLQRYYTFVGERLARKRRWLSLIVLTASSGAAVVLFSGLSLEVARVLALAVAAATVWAELADYSGKSARSLGTASDLSHLATEMRALWFRLDEMEAAAAERIWRDLDARATEATRHVPAALLGYRSLQERAEEETYGYWTGWHRAAAAEA